MKKLTKRISHRPRAKTSLINQIGIYAGRLPEQGYEIGDAKQETYRKTALDPEEGVDIKLVRPNNAGTRITRLILPRYNPVKGDSLQHVQLVDEIGDLDTSNDPTGELSKVTETIAGVDRHVSEVTVRDLRRVLGVIVEAGRIRAEERVALAVTR